MEQLKASCKALLLTVLLISTFGLINACKQSENGKEETNKVKTEWTNCQELIEYIRYSNYEGVASEFGDAEMGEPWFESGTVDAVIAVRFNKIRLNGKPLVVVYENGISEYGDPLKPRPTRFKAIRCDGSWNESKNISEINSSNNLETTESNEYDFDVELWKTFKVGFLIAISNKQIDEVEMRSLESTEFHGGTISDYFSGPDAWESINKSLESGYKDYQIEDKQYSSAKITNDDKLIFVRKGDFWKWYGFKTN